MKVGVIAEGVSDITVVKAILKKMRGIDGSDILSIRPEGHLDETDLDEKNFSNWNLVLRDCADINTFQSFFDIVDEESFLVIQIDTAERGEKGYDVPLPKREKGVDWHNYSEQLYLNIKSKIEATIPAEYRERILYAIAVEEMDAWLIPVFENNLKEDSAKYANPKEHLERLIGKLAGKEKQKYIDTQRKMLNYTALSKGLAKNLKLCRERNQSLNAFCLSVDKVL